MTSRSSAVMHPPVQRWALVAGWASLLLPMPAVIWRLAMLAGVDVGFADADMFRSQTAGVLYVLGIDAAQVIAAVAVFGLIRPWSERWPAWVPKLAGRAIPPLVPAVLGALGAVAVLFLVGQTFTGLILAWTGIAPGWTPDIGMDAAERTLLLACYIPFGVWPIAMAATVAAFWVRHWPLTPRR